jgi:hypothetical protein
MYSVMHYRAVLVKFCIMKCQLSYFFCFNANLCLSQLYINCFLSFFNVKHDIELHATHLVDQL